jgi:hypothetical protein
MSLPLPQLFQVAAIPMAVGLMASICIARLRYRRRGTVHLEDLPDSP